jgi:hypothetical protein
MHEKTEKQVVAKLTTAATSPGTSLIETKGDI